MFALNIKTAAAASPMPPGGRAPSPAPVVDVDADDYNDDSFVSTPSTNSSGRRAPAVGAAVPLVPRTPEPPVERDCGGYPHCPIFIPSKGRSDLDRSTMAVLVRDLVPFVLVVEQDEAELYSAMVDRLVGQYYGFADMTYAAAGSTSDPATEASGSEGSADGGAGAAAATATSGTPTAASTPPASADLWPFPCACCARSDSSGAHPSPPGQAQLSADALKALAQRLSTAFHHGYTFTPPVDTDGTEETGGTTAMPAGGRRPTSAFELHDVDSVRALFVIEVLPETNRGVSYVRNYILQVLAPRIMVACGVDRSGNVEELCLCGPGEHATLTTAALRMAALEPGVYSAMDDRQATDSFLDERRASTRSTGPAPGDSGSNSTASTTAPASSPSTAASPSQRSALPRDSPRVLHGLFGFYWVLDDDIYGFYRSHGADSKNELVSARAMLREVEARLLRLRRNADIATLPPPPVPPPAFPVSAAAASGGNGAGGSTPASTSAFLMPLQQQQQQQPVIFTSKEDALMHNYVPSGASRLPTMRNYNCYYTTACFSLEYNRFALDAAVDVLSVNSYNNIACLFNYALLHNPPQMRFFPPGVPNVRRPEDALVGYLGHSMLWYRFAVREDYDFTLQLIARGLYTLRFRSLAFDVPQMMKVRGGMTDYYRNCHDEIRQQNDRFILQWPAVAQHWVKGKEGSRRNDMRVRWDLLSPARARYPGAFLYLNSALPQLQAQRLTDPGGATAVAAGEGDTTAAPAPSATTTAATSAAETETESRKRARPISGPVSPSTDTATHASRRPYVPPAVAVAPASAARDRNIGYVVERWREITDAEALEHAGLVALPHDDIHIGRTVAVIPPFFTQQPSVVRATVIERAALPVEGHADASTTQEQQSAMRVMWTAVAQDVRGMPFLHVETCYEVPADGTEAAAARIDRFFESEAATGDE